MNNVTLTGRLVKDPKVKTSENGTAYSKFVIAVRGTRIEDGERKSDFIPCICFGKMASNLAEYCKKGRFLEIKGHIQTGAYIDDNGRNRYTQIVACDNIEYGAKPVSSYKEPEIKNDEMFSSDDIELETPEGFAPLEDDDIPF